ncbi:MAG: endolytic transglycosylase MltG [Treponema sp.]|nr:endolytic transglycosylase MltG [Treponema sp.]
MKKSKKIKIIVLSLFLLAVFFLAALAVCAVHLSRPVDGSGSGREVKLSVVSGETVREVADNLYENKLIHSADFFYLVARYSNKILKKPFLLKTGVYTVKSSQSLWEILELLNSGKQDYIRVLVPEGLTIRKIAAVVEKSGLCSAEDFIAASRDEELLKSFSIPAGTFQGFLFPDTYFFTPGMTAAEIVSMMAENFFRHINSIPFFTGKKESEIYEAVILASIVEREYRSKEEAPLIASVFKNRQKIGMGLYSCATIEYIITEIQGRPHPDVITYEDLKIDSPFNTYLWAALPPAPISNPGLVALTALAETPETDYLYFTLTDSEAGTHTFSRSFTAHVRAGGEFRTKKAAGSN